MRWIRGLAALGALGGVLIGAPAALLAWGHPWIGLDSLARPEDGTLLLTTLTLLGWLAWAAFAASTLVEGLRLCGSGHRGWRIPLLGGLQNVCAGLLLAVLALAPATSNQDVGREASAAAVPSPDPLPVSPSEEPAESPEPGSVTEGEHEHYRVLPGDDLWSISANLLGDGSRWRELAAANPEHLHDPTARLVAGTRLELPATAAAKKITVERGDTLSALSLEHLGSARHWPEIAKANDHLIDDPDHIEVGWRLSIPGAAAGRPNTEEQEPPAKKKPAAERAPMPVQAQQSPAEQPTGSASSQAGLPTRADGSSVTRPTDGPGAAERPAGPAVSADAEADRPAAPILGALGTLAAAALIGVIEYRRFLRLRSRPIGRRLIPPPDSAARLRAALGARQRPDPMTALDRALRAIGRHCRARRLPLPELERVVVSGDTVRFEWASTTSLPPVGFTGTREYWSASGEGPAENDQPCPYPALVSLGSTENGDLVLVDAERSRVLGVAATDAEARHSALTSMAVELACAPWSAEARLIAVGADSELVVLAGGERVRAACLDDALAEVRRLVIQRRAALNGTELSELRVDPDRADAVAPLVLCVLEDLPDGTAEELDSLLAGPACGVAVLLGTRADPDAQWRVDGDAWAPRGHLTGLPEPLAANSIPRSARAGVGQLLRQADDPATTQAPWWRGRDQRADNVLALPQRAYRGDDVDIVRLVPAAENPYLELIGPAELRGAAGPEPTRSRQQLIESCAWLLEHPGSTATAMADGLGIAESTRRSNLSRLRAWLGVDPDGQPYLPDAYSGRVVLHSGVSSDWHRLELLLAPGIDRVGDATLIAALELVRGAPLADASPAQWHWAEELRTDVSCALHDVGLVLTDRALSAGNIDLARWAAARALVVAAEDEQLLCARIRTEHRAGNSAEVRRLVDQVTRQARLLEVDLLPETIALCQRVLEGRLRNRTQRSG